MPDRNTTEPGFAIKSVLQQAEKEAIAREAATLVHPGTAIAMSAGTTTYAFSHELVGVPGLFGRHRQKLLACRCVPSAPAAA